MADLRICATKLAWPRVFWIKPGLNNLVLSNLGHFGCHDGATGRPIAPCEAAIREVLGCLSIADASAIQYRLTDFQDLLMPLGGFTLSESEQPNGASFASRIAADYAIKRMHFRIYNSTLNVTFEAGHLPIQVPLLKFDCAYPISQVPIVFGCASSGVVYYYRALSDVFRRTIYGFPNATLWGTGRASVYLGEKAGKVVATTADVYASIVGILFGILICGGSSGKY